MKLKYLSAMLITMVLGFNALAVPTCEDQGYVNAYLQVNVTSDWVSNVAGYSVGTATDGTLTGATAVAYDYGFEIWNHNYILDWCAAKESAMTSSIPGFGSPYPIAGTFHCQWFDEPTSVADVTSIIDLHYCKHPGSISKY